MAAIAFALGSMMYKRAYAEGATLAHTAILNNVVLGIVFLPLLALEKRPVAWEKWHQPVITSFFYVIGHLLNVVALRFGDVSLATPLLGSKIIFVALVGWLVFGSQISGGLWAAAALASIGVAMMGYTEVHFSRRLGLTTTTALGSALFFSLTDSAIQAWGSGFGGWSFLALQFAGLGAFSLLMLPWFGMRSLRAPASAWKWIFAGIALSGLQAILITCTIAFWKNAVGVNVVYATRGFWSIVFVWTVGHWVQNTERATIGGRGMALRLGGTVLIFGAMVLTALQK